MLYVERDEDGKVISVSMTKGENHEEANFSDPDVKAYLSETDTDMVRVLEDLIDVLVQKNIFSITDLPESAQLKLLYRKNTRSMLDNSENCTLIDSDKIL